MSDGPGNVPAAAKVEREKKIEELLYIIAGAELAIRAAEDDTKMRLTLLAVKKKNLRRLKEVIYGLPEGA